MDARGSNAFQIPSHRYEKHKLKVQDKTERTKKKEGSERRKERGEHITQVYRGWEADIFVSQYGDPFTNELLCIYHAFTMHLPWDPMHLP